MGVSIHYRGTLHQPQDVTTLIHELSDIAKAHNWNYQVIDDDWDAEITLRLEHHEDETVVFAGNAGLKGIVLMPHPESEGMALLFDKEGVLRSLLSMTDPPETRSELAHVKTQFAGIDLHIQLVHLLEYVGKKYMRDWEIMDDSGYFTHRDRDRAQEVFHIVGDAINAVTEAFDTIEIPPDFTGDEEKVISLIEERIKTYLPGAEVRRYEEEE